MIPARGAASSPPRKGASLSRPAIHLPPLPPAGAARTCIQGKVTSRMSLGKQATTGAIWNYATFLASKGLLLVATIILAQVLDQDEIGLMSMALLVIMVFDLFRDFGTGPALIQRQRDVKEATEVAFVVSAALGGGL